MAVVSIKNKLRRGNLLVGNEAYDPAGMVPIATTVVGSGGSSTVTFSSIPSTYTHLQLRVFARWSSSDYASMTFNSGSFLRRHYLYGTGSTVAAGSDTTNAPIQGTSTTGIFGANIVDILDYANTNKNRTVRTLFGWDSNGGGVVQLNSHLYDTTAAITSITLTTTGSFAQYSHFALYGIKSA